MSDPDHETIESLRMSDRDKRRLVDDVERSRQATVHHDRRTSLRVPFPASAAVLRITHPNGTVVRHAIVPRNLSRRGIGFFLGRFLYPDSVCTVELRALDGERVSIAGVVRHCALERGIVHLVRVVFDQPIDLTAFVRLTPEQLEALKLELAEAAEADAPKGSQQGGAPREAAA